MGKSLKILSNNIVKIVFYVFAVLGSLIFVLEYFSGYFYFPSEMKEYGGEGTLYANRIYLNDKGYIIVTGHTGASHGYFGKASMTIEREKCKLKIDRMHWKFESDSSEFQYIFPDFTVCKSVIMGSGEVVITQLGS